jgi:hypothetical protein
MELGRERRWLWTVAAVAVVGTAVFIASRKSARPQVAFAREAPVNAAGYARKCPAGTPIPSRSYDLGRSFAGLKLTSREDICSPAAPAGVTVVSGPSEAIGYVSVVYGSCTPTSSAGCVPPLNVQSWPECARDPNTYREPGPRRAKPELMLNPSEAITIQAAPWIPARAFEGGTRVEIYSGDTTIVVFASNRHLANAAGMALASAAADQAVPSSASQLRIAARQPGDGSTCQRRLPTRHRRSNDQS